jgi:hypothetical protein
LKRDDVCLSTNLLGKGRKIKERSDEKKERRKTL